MTTSEPASIPDLSALVEEAHAAHTRAEAALNATIDGIEDRMRRLGDLGKVAAIARAVRAETERDKLRALLDQAGGDPTTAEIVRLRAELAEARAGGRCGAEPPADIRISFLPVPCCTLTVGHAGWHKDTDNGADWMPEPAEVEYAIEIQEDDGTWSLCFIGAEDMRTPTQAADRLEGTRAKCPEHKFRVVIRETPPYRPLSDEELDALVTGTAAGR